MAEAAPAPAPFDEREPWPAGRLAAYQLASLKGQLARLDRDSPFWRDRFRAAGLAPAAISSLADLGALPPLTKDDLRPMLEADPVSPAALAVPSERVARIHFSSGTGGLPTPCYWTAADLARWADLYARYFHACGLGQGDRLQVMFGYAWFVGGLGATAGAERLGATVIPAGNLDTRRQIETIFRFRATAVIGTPSFMAHLAEEARAMGRDLAASDGRLVAGGGEPGASVPATRARLAAAWGADVIDCYGALEFQPIAWDVGDGLGPALAEDFVFAEVVDPGTKAPVPDGEPGVLVLTHLDKEALPLVRFLTGDVVVRQRVTSPSGRTHARLVGGVRGRADDMLIVRGVNVFPSAIEEVVRGTEGATGEYRLVVDPALADPATGSLGRLRLTVETDAPGAAFADRVARRVKEILGVGAEVDAVAEGSLPRSVHKAARIVRP